MKINTRFPLIFILVFFTLFPVACVQNEQEGDAIDPELRANIDVMNQRVIKALSMNNAREIISMFPDTIKRNSPFFADLRNTCELTHEVIKSKTYVPWLQFYEIRPDLGAEISIYPLKDNEHAYSINYISGTRKSYVSLGLIKDSTTSLLISTIFSKMENNWKLVKLWVYPYKIMNRDAIDWYYIAKQHYQNGDIADAATSSGLAMALLTPAGKQWHYELEAKIEEQNSEIVSTAKSVYKFPYEVGQVWSSPSIINVSTAEYNYHYYPVINYVSKLAFQDTSKLSRECDSMNMIIGSIFQGMDYNNQFILYKASNKEPKTDSEQVIQFRLVRASPANWYGR